MKASSESSTPKSQLSPKIRKARLKARLNELCFPDSEGKQVKNNWHHSEWLKLAEQHPALLIEAAREHSKTQLFGIVEPLLEIKANRNIRILIISDVFDKSTERAAVLRENIERNRAYRALDPPVEIVRKKGDSEFTVSRNLILKEPTVRSTYAGGPISGGRYDLVIADDLVNWLLNSTTPGKRARLRRWWDDEVLNSIAKNGRIWVIGTRQHHEDLYETIKQNDTFICVTYPAIDERYEENNTGATGGDASCLWPEMHDYASLMAKKAANPDSFLRQQQQIAVPESGLVYRRQLVDAAFERGKGNHYDPEAAQFLALDPGYGKRAALLAVQERAGDGIETWREHSFTQLDDDEISRVFVEHCREFGVEAAYIDAADPGLIAAIARDLRAEGLRVRLNPVPFSKYKRLAISTTRWLLQTGQVAWGSEDTFVHTPGRDSRESCIFRKEIRDYALKPDSDDEPMKSDDHGPDAFVAYASKWIVAWTKATGSPVNVERG